MIFKRIAKVLRGPDPAYRVADPSTEDVDGDELSPFLGAWPGPAPTVADVVEQVKRLRGQVRGMSDGAP